MSILGGGILKGMKVTLKNFVGSFFDKKRELRDRLLMLAPFDYHWLSQRVFSGNS